MGAIILRNDGSRVPRNNSEWNGFFGPDSRFPYYRTGGFFGPEYSHLPQRHFSPLVGCAITANDPAGKISMPSMAVCLTLRMDLSIFWASIHFLLCTLFFVAEKSDRKMYAFSMLIGYSKMLFSTHSDEEPKKAALF